jgi:phage-related protein
MQQFATRGVNVAAQLAKQMGKSENEVRQMVRDGEISFKQFAEYMDGAFGEHATKANETYTGSLANVKAALSRLGAAIQVPRLEAMRKIFNALTDVIDNFAEALEPAIEAFAKFTENGSNQAVKFLESLNFDRLTKALPGMIDGVKNVFVALLAVLKPVGKAFREIFPKKSGEELASFTKGFKDFTATLKVGPEKAELLKRTFAGLFAIFHIGVVIIGKIIKMFANLLGVAGKSSGGILTFTGSIGDFLVSVDKALTEGGLLTAFFDGLTKILKAPIRLLGALSEAIFGLFGGGVVSRTDRFSKSISGLSDNLKPSSKALESLGKAWDGMVNIVKPWIGKIGEAFKSFGNILADAFSDQNYDRTFQAIQTGLLASLVMAIKKALGGASLDISGGVFSSITDTFKVLTGNLMAMQQNLKVDTLMKIAMAIGVLAAGVIALSMIKSEDLAKAMSAIAVGLSQLLGAMALLSKIAGTGAFITLPIMATGLIALAVAVTILAGAVAIFSTLSWESLAKGLLGVGGALVAVGLGTQFLTAPRLMAIGLALIPMAIGMNLLALAVRQLGTLSWEEMGKGIGGMAVALVAVGSAIIFIPPQALIRIGVGLTGVAIALNLLAAAVLVFGSIDLFTMGKGLVGIGASLVILGSALLFIPPNLAIQAAGLILVSIAMTGLAGAIGAMGSLDILTIVKGIAALGAVLLVLGIGLKFMAGTLAGSAALLAAATALAVIAPVLGFLGSLKIGVIVKGLAAIAAILGVLAIAGTFASAPLLALGLALAPLGLLMVATAASFYLFAKALQVIGAEGAKGIAVMIASMTAFIVALPTMVIAFVKGLVDIIAAIAEIAPKVTESLAKIVFTMVDVFVKAAPALLIAIGTLIGLIATAVIQNGPKIVEAGFALLVAFLSGLSKNIGKVTSSASNIVIGFLKELTKHTVKLVDAGAKFLVKFLEGIAKNIGKVVGAVSKVVVKFLEAVASHSEKVIRAGFGILSSFIKGIVGGFSDMIKTGVAMIIKLIEGIGQAVPKLIKTAVETVGKVIKAMAEGLVKLVDVGAKAVIDFMNGMARVIRDRAPELRRAGANLAGAIISGMTFGLSDKASGLFRKLGEIIAKIPRGVKKLLGIRSPSSVMAKIGHQTMAGLTKGIFDGGSGSERAMETSGNKVVKMAKITMSNLGDILDGVMDLDPVISPVLDLSAVHKEAGKLKYISDMRPIVAAASLNQASAISQEKTASETSKAVEVAQAGPTFQFEQNNYSPEALSDVEIYRKTHNQLSQVKSAIGLVS